MKLLPRPKTAVMMSFSLMALYFVGIGVLSMEYPLQLVGAVFVGGIHALLGWGIYSGKEWSIGLGKYLSFVDLIFSILWMMLGVLPQGAALFFLSALVLVLLSDSEVEGEILGRV
ncbi:hypothetical protein [Thermococcus gammatolerans]|uniref:Uncharacterized protein n=1 Tax=Thermococcus gammatolerans (strain DSM 15229 / JCM 11827 / EJ3) TaxID=593117 RepID=C5A1R9_THEGJ|nr:hypothetical protein [Thermococcus gammatolerans]ACS34338.1 Conserved hypothetical protein [Thermococcus gammatolerans EJ3]